MLVSNYLDLSEDMRVDEETGISLKRLTYDQAFSLYFAEVRAGASLPAHFHRSGIEVYQIISGEGKIELGTPMKDKVCWTSNTTIKSGDCFSIQPQEVHRLNNTGNGNMRILFCTPPSHLSEDRTFIIE